MMPGGLRLGTPAMMTAGFKAQNFIRVADIMERAVQIIVKLDYEAR
jgi:glycine hydroxymethyltransferase